MEEDKMKKNIYMFVFVVMNCGKGNAILYVVWCKIYYGCVLEKRKLGLASSFKLSSKSD